MFRRLASLLAVPMLAAATDDLPLPVVRGEVLVHEDFSAADATAKWRWGAGKWTVADGVLRGTETTERKHAAGIACQRNYHDAVIQFRFRFAGGRDAILLLRNKFGNLCRTIISPTEMRIQKDRPNLPADNKEKTMVLGTAPVKLVAGEWYSVTAVVHGEEFGVALQGHATLKGRDRAINVDKTEIEFLASGDSVLFDDLNAWTVAM
jgi:glycerophosphoryl diester phosphodiesterase